MTEAMAMKMGAFEEMTSEEMGTVNGGGVVAAVYALGFVFGCSPLGAICICGGVAITAVAAGIAVSRA